MPQNYKKKTKTKYDIENLKNAIEDVKSKKVTLGRAPALYCVSKIAIFDYIKKSIVQLVRDYPITVRVIPNT